MSHPGFRSLEKAKEKALAWAGQRRVPLHAIEYVATFEEWDDGVGVWIFYATDADLKRGSIDGTNAQIQERLLEELRTANYPFSSFPRVAFEFDSNENVVRNFEGNYFYRLR